MNEDQRRRVFEAQTTNVRELNRVWRHANRQLNALLNRGESAAVQVETKLMALVYCALAEALFSKLIHTPDAFSLDYIEQIKKAAKDDGVKAGWLKCAELACQGLDAAKTNHEPNVRQKITELIDSYVFDPSLLRNKLAHGQWSVALNRENSDVNAELSQEIENLDVVEMYRRRFALEKLSAIMEDLVESPNKAHRRDYWKHIAELEDKQREMALWTLQGKVADLRAKRRPVGQR